MRSQRQHRHASIVFRRGNPIAGGYNDGEEHAEANAIHGVDRVTTRPKNLVMVNIRLTKAGKIGLAKPCPACLDLLKEKKFRKVIYSTNAGTFEEIYL